MLFGRCAGGFKDFLEDGLQLTVDSKLHVPPPPGIEDETDDDDEQQSDDVDEGVIREADSWWEEAPSSKIHRELLRSR